MGTLRTTNVQDNEIVKAADMQGGFDAVINNLRLALSMAFGNKQNWIIGGEIVPKIGGQGLQCSIKDGLLGYNATSKDFFVNDDFGDEFIAFEAENYDRIATVSVQSSEIGILPQRRAFVDRSTNIVGYQNTATQKERRIIFNILYTDYTEETAKPTPQGFVKIAEVVIPANATSISECTIYNCTSDVSTEDNPGWTNDKRETINIGQLSRLIEMFRLKHKQDGDFKNDVVRTENIITNSSTGSLNASDIPIGVNITQADVGEVSTNVSDKTSTVINKLANVVNELYRDYLQNGVYTATGSIEIRKNDSLATDDRVNIVFSDENSIQLKKGDTILCEIENGNIYEGAKNSLNKLAKVNHTHTSNNVTAMTGYAKASSASAIATTDTLNTAIGKLEKSIDNKSASNHTHTSLASLVLTKTTDASGTAYNTPALTIGGTKDQTHIEIDGNEIMAKANATSTGTLYINGDGGTVDIGGYTKIRNLNIPTNRSDFINLNDWVNTSDSVQKIIYDAIPNKKVRLYESIRIIDPSDTSDYNYNSIKIDSEYYWVLTGITTTSSGADNIYVPPYDSCRFVMIHKTYFSLPSSYPSSASSSSLSVKRISFHNQYYWGLLVKRPNIPANYIAILNYSYYTVEQT